jgi:hypothetical protein
MITVEASGARCGPADLHRFTAPRMASAFSDGGERA